MVPEQGAEGVIISQGANIGGWSLYAKSGKLKYCYNWSGLKHFYVEASTPIPAGEHQVRMEFAYAGGGLGKGGKVSKDYGSSGNAFNGRVKGVQLAIAEAAEDADHLIDPADAMRMAMARQ
jgi:arylsulfatase